MKDTAIDLSKNVDILPIHFSCSHKRSSTVKYIAEEFVFDWNDNKAISGDAKLPAVVR